MNIFSFLELGFACLGLITLAATYQDNQERRKQKKAGTPIPYPSLYHQLQFNTFNFYQNLNKKTQKKTQETKEESKP